MASFENERCFNDLYPWQGCSGSYQNCVRGHCVYDQWLVMVLVTGVVAFAIGIVGLSLREDLDKFLTNIMSVWMACALGVMLCGSIFVYL